MRGFAKLRQARRWKERVWKDNARQAPRISNYSGGAIAYEAVYDR